MVTEDRHILQVFVGSLSPQYEALSVEVSKTTTCQSIVFCVVEKLGLSDARNYELAEVIGNAKGQECKERRLGSHETPVCLQMLWPQMSSENCDAVDCHEYRFCLREKISSDSLWAEPSQLDSQLIKDYFYKFLYQPKDKEYPDLCQLSDLNEQTLLENLKARFQRCHIYTYVGSILIAVNPFKYYPIYNPKYVKLYQNCRLGELPPHIFAIADAAYHSMLKQRKNQCVVISGESGSGKTESTLFLLHHLTMLSQKGAHGSGVEQTILSSGPVLEAFGNAKTAHNNNSSRFGKFIQVSYKENGLVQGACVQKYLLEKSRICSQSFNERSYHVFYYLLNGACAQEKQSLHLLSPPEYNYLNQSKCYSFEGCDEQFEFVRLKQSMEMVGFTSEKQQKLFAVLSAILLIGNIEFQPKKSSYHHDESVLIRNISLVSTVSSLLGVSEETLVSALTTKKAKVQGEILVMHYRLPEALAARDALAKCLYGALFEWIVLQVNYSLISLKELSNENCGNSIGVLDIFGFEDFGNYNRFEQFCINYANEHLQHYFNQHVFEYEQEEYQREGIQWNNIEFKDNVHCLALIEGKPNGLLCILDDQCNFPGATNETFLQKINSVHKHNELYEIPQKRESAFIIKHYAGRVKYQVSDIREKNLDLMRPELISVLKNSKYGVVRELAGADPVAVFRWSILRAFFNAANAFRQAGIRYSKQKGLEHRKIKQRINLDSSRILAAIENTQNRLRKTRHTRSRYKLHGPRVQKNLKTVKALAQRTQILSFQGRFPGSRKPPNTVTGQFQLSLQALMETLNKANPYFIRCIKSNANKEPNVFDDELVVRQLRYTGMLETVRIRQAGFNVRMTYDEFIHHYRILLPKGLLSSQQDVRNFLLIMHLDMQEYEIGVSKIFMRESQKLKLDSCLHQTILSRIIFIQRWYRSRLQRSYFVTIRKAALRIQTYIRMWLAQQILNNLKLRQQAATFIQKCWRGYKVRKWYKNLRASVIAFQACVQGNFARQRFSKLVESWRRQGSVRSSLSKESEATSVTSIPASVADQPSLSSEFYPKPLPRKHSVQKANQRHLERLPSQDSVISSKPPFPEENYKQFGRRHSESAVQHARRISNNSLAMQQAGNHHSDENLMAQIPSPPSSPSYINYKQDDGFHVQYRPRSFRHRSYSKVASSSEFFDENSEDKISFDDESNKGSDTGSAMKFNQLKKQFRLFNKREGSFSESEDGLSCDSSLPQTPSSFGDAPISFLQMESQGLEYKNSKLIFDFKDKNENGSDTRLPLENTGKESAAGSSDPSSEEKLPPACEVDVLKKLIAKSPHNLKQSQLKKGEICSSCEKIFGKFFINHGYKCIVCHRSFHMRCLEASFSVPCFIDQRLGKENISPIPKKQRRFERDQKWNVTRTAQFTDRSDEVIKDPDELRNLEEFIARKLYLLEDSEKFETRTQSLDRGSTRPGLGLQESNPDIRLRERKDSQVDILFCQSLRRFKSNLLSCYSVAFQDDTHCVSLKYKDLIKNFEQVMNTLCRETTDDTSFPVTMGVNAFRGFLDEFIKEKNKRPDDKNLAKKRRRSRRKKKEKKVEETVYKNHRFVNIMVNIPTQCEVCNSFLWLSMKALSCQKCKLTCHSKCYSKVEAKCSQQSEKAFIVESSTATGQGITLGRVFGVPLENLVVQGEKIPSIIDRLIMSIELYGLYAEGLYRKSGASTKVQELKNNMESDPDSVSFEEAPVHAMANLLKAFLRELPEPLLTFEAYDPLLHAGLFHDPEDCLETTLSIIKNLPKANYFLFERLVFHLARVAQQECHNLMTCNSLAIVFTPCILRNQKPQSVHESLSDISKQTQVIEMLISRQLAKVEATLLDIDHVDNATATAGAELTNIRLSKHFGSTATICGNPSELVVASDADSISTGIKRDPRLALAEYNLEEKIEALQDTRQRLAMQLPSLIHTSSEEDLLTGDTMRSSSLEELQSIELVRRRNPVVRRRKKFSLSASGESEEPQEDAVMV